MPEKFAVFGRLVLLTLLISAVACVTDPPPAAESELDLAVVPKSVTVNPGEHVVFEVYEEVPEGASSRLLVKKSFGSTYTGEGAGTGVSWSATGGIIGDNGHYAASLVPGNYLVIATAHSGLMADTGQVIVTETALTPVSTVTIEPGTVTAAPGETAQLAAVLRAADGAVLTGRAVTWSSDRTDVADVSASGLVTAVGTGSATITATNGGVSGSAGVTVSDVAVASVSVSPTSAELNQGETIQLNAVPQDAEGNALSGRPVSWSSDNASVATVDAAGVVAAQAPGSATITATSGSAAGTASVSVTAPTTYSLANECATPQSGWIWCDDFEQDRLGAYFEYDDRSGAFSRATNVGMSGSTAMRARWVNAGDVSAGNLKLAFGATPSSYFDAVDNGTANYRELYWRLYLRHQPGWVGGGAGKLSRATVFGSSDWAQAMIAHVWEGRSLDLALDPASGTDNQGNLLTTTYNDFANLRWLGYAGSATPIFDATHVGQWYCIESHVRLNQAGQSDGVFQLWIDDVLEAERAGLNWLGAYTNYGLNALFVENHWEDGAPQAQERYIDNLVVSTNRIGCGDPVPPPDDSQVASVVVSPNSVELAEGSTAQLAASLYDAAGNTLYGRSVSWASSNPGIATVSGNGLVAAQAPGTAQITATSEGRTGTAAITVSGSAPPPPPPNGGDHPNEPDGYVPFAEHRFDAVPNWPPSTSGSGLVSGWWWNYSGGTPYATTVNDASAPVSAGGTIDSRFATALPGGSAPVNFGGWDARGESHRKSKVYHSMWFKIVGATIPNHYILIKWGFFGVANADGQGGNEVFLSLPGEGRPHNAEVSDFSIRIDRQGGKVRFENQQLNSGKRVQVGQWHHLETVLELNDVGAANGVFRVWLDGTLIHNWTDFEFRSGGATNGFGGWKFNPTWGGGGPSPSRDWHVRIDHVYMSGVDQN